VKMGRNNLSQSKRLSALSEKLAVLTAHVEQLEFQISTVLYYSSLKIVDFDSVQTMLEKEIERSKRYDHFFAFATFLLPSKNLYNTLRELKSSVRKVDTLKPLEGSLRVGTGKIYKLPEGNNNLIGLILPETGEVGLQSILRRLENDFNGVITKYGQAVYPFDSIQSKLLLEIAITGYHSN